MAVSKLELLLHTEIKNFIAETTKKAAASETRCFATHLPADISFRSKCGRAAAVGYLGNCQP